MPFTGPINAKVTPPGSKSITNRALLIAALARGQSVLRGALLADDTQAMIDCVRNLGARVTLSDEGTKIVVDGIGGDLSSSGFDFFARQSGTTARFMLPVLGLGATPLRLDAEDAMRRRPMADAIECLRSLGVEVSEDGERGCLPLTIRGPVKSRSEMPTVAIDGSVSSQFTSGLLLAAPSMPNGLSVVLGSEVVSRPYLEMTVDVMRAFGAVVRQPSENEFVVEPGAYSSTEFVIEPDASAASYYFAAAAICGGSIQVEGLGSQSIQGDLRFVDVLASMGAQVKIDESSVTVTGAALHGVTVDFSQISDTAQTIAAVAVFADSPTTITGIGFIRKKETNRIAAVVRELQRLGVDARENPDGFTVIPGPTEPAAIETYDDHRMAMSMALIGFARSGVSILDPDCVNKTFPTYFQSMEELRPEANE